MIKKNVTPAGLVKFLNEMLKTDKNAIETLFSVRIPCNKKMANHKTVQVMAFGKDRPGKEYQFYLVGLIGLLNGLIGSFGKGERKGWGCIAMICKPRTSKIQKFIVLKNK